MPPADHVYEISHRRFILKFPVWPIRHPISFGWPLVRSCWRYHPQLLENKDRVFFCRFIESLPAKVVTNFLEPKLQVSEVSMPLSFLLLFSLFDPLERGFEERLNLVAGLNIKVYPSEGLKSRRIKCGMNIRDIQKTGEQDGFAKVVYGRPCRSRTCDTLIKSLILLSLPDQSVFHVMLKPQQSPANYFCPERISNSVRNGMIWVGLSVPQGDKGGGLYKSPL